MKSILERALPRERFPMAWRYASYIYQARKGERRPFPVDLERALSILFGELKAGSTLVQIGANDGITGDPLHRFVADGRWPAVVAEPVPQLFFKLQMTYAESTNVRCAHCAVAKSPGTLPFYVVDNSAGRYPQHFDQIGSLDRTVIEKQQRDYPDILNDICRIDVECVSFEELVATSGFQEATVIHTDTEGYDLEILETIDFDAFGTRAILFEHVHLDPNRYFRFCRRLRELGFELRDGGTDTLAVRDGTRVANA